MLRAAVLHEFTPQSLYHLIQYGKRPATLEDPLGRFVVRRLALVAFLAGGELRRDKLPAAALARSLAIFFVGDKEFERTQKKRPEPAFCGVGAIEISSFKHASEELLCEILRLVGRISAPAHIGI